MYLQNSWSSIGSASDAFEQKSVSSLQSSFIDLPRELTQMLASAGPYLHRDAVLLQKVCWKLYLILFYMCAYKTCILWLKLESHVWLRNQDKLEWRNRIHEANPNIVGIRLKMMMMMSWKAIFHLLSATSWLQVCRVLRGYYLSALELAAGGAVLPGGDGGSLDPRFHLREARSRVEEALGTCLLPSLQLIPANPAVGQEIWELMSLLPYEVNITVVIFMLLHLRFTKHASMQIDYLCESFYLGTLSFVRRVGKRWWMGPDGFGGQANCKSILTLSDIKPFYVSEFLAVIHCFQCLAHSALLFCSWIQEGSWSDLLKRI